MSLEDDKIKKIAEMREMLEEREKNLNAELEGVRTLLDFLNDLLLEKSFKRVEEIAKPSYAKPVDAVIPETPQQGRVVPLKTGAGDFLGNFYIEEGTITIVPEPSLRLDINIPPFTAFLMDKILGKMRETDLEAVKHGEITPDSALSFKVEKEDEIIRQITVKNVNPQRERELRSAVRWTLEKMYDKIKGPT